MSWNYRVMKKYYDDEIHYGIHEVFYGDDMLWTEKPVFSCGARSLEELRNNIEWLVEALDKEVLSKEDL